MIHQPKYYQLMPQLAIAFGLWLPLTAAANDGNELKRITWSIPSHEEIQTQVETWLAESRTAAKVAQEIRELWSTPIDETQRLTALADSFSLANENAGRLVEFSRSLRNSPELPPFEFLSASETPAFMRNNLRLLYARWLAQNQLYDETLEQLSGLEPKDVIDPAALLFYQSVAYHRLLKKKECLPVVERLLEQETRLPKRFGTLAKLIRSDLEPLEEDSLDEVSRLMDNIKVRLGHGRAGTRVRKEEDDVIAKLDKMIKELEDKAKQAQQAASSGGKAGDSLNPSAPMQDSMPGGASGPGNVDPKQISKRADWGDLPPKERQQALQQLGEGFPSHYRDVIEEYFRKIAGDQSDP